MKPPIYPTEEDQIFKFMQTVYALRRYEKANFERPSFLSKQKIEKCKFIIDQILSGRRINNKFEIIPETTQEDFFSENQEKK